MTQANYLACLKAVLVEEGGNSDDPRDPGGRTSRGVTQKVYDAYRERKGQAHRDVYLMDDIELRNIYKFQYWNEINGDYLPAGVDLVIFDYAVNSGPRRAIRDAQLLMGIQSDGTMGNLSLQEILKEDPDEFIEAYQKRRLAFLHSLGTWGTFGSGWTKRVNRIKAKALQMVGTHTLPAHPIVEKDPAEVTPKADPREKTLPKTDTGKGAIISAAGTAGTVLTDTASKIQPLGDLGTAFKFIFAALLVVGVAFTIYSILKSIKQQGVA